MYSISYKERIQARSAVRALFAEVYEMLLKTSHKIELRTFDPEITDCPQFARIDDINCITNAINFGITRGSGLGVSYVIEVTFEPAWSYKRVNGFKKLNSAMRHGLKSSDMSPKSICKFILNCVNEIRVRELVVSAKETQLSNDCLRQAENHKQAILLKEKNSNIEKGRITVFSCHDVPKFSENEVWVQFRGSSEDAQRVLEFIEREFPSQTLDS